MIPGILAKKIGMTQIFGEAGTRIPVTVIEAGPCQVYEIKKTDKDGYNAVKLAFNDAKEKNLNKPQREDIKKKKLMPKKYVREIRCSEVSDVKVGEQMKADLFQEGDFVDVTGVSKGKGFQGGMKRHGWSGGKDTHGSMSHRAPGSIGQSSYPSRVFRGLGMPGHMGNEKVTVQNLKVIEVDAENNIILVEGAVPGPNGAYLVLKFAKKKKIAERIQKPEKAAEEDTDQNTDGIPETAEDKAEDKKEEVAAPEVPKKEAAAPEEEAAAPAEENSEIKEN